MKIKIIHDINYTALQRQVNQWFVDQSNIDVVSIQYQSTEQDISVMIQYTNKTYRPPGL